MNKMYSFKIISQLIFIATLGAVIGICFYSNKYIYYEFLIIPTLIGVFIQFIKHLNTANQQINFFFESIINEDFSSSYTTKSKNEIQNNSLVKFSDKIQNVIHSSVQREQYFKTLIEHIDTGILTFNNEGFVIDVNSNFKKLLGLDQLTYLKQLNKVSNVLMETLKKVKHKEQKLITIESKRKKAK